MKHLPFSEWIVSDEPLTEAQATELAHHLAGCPQCGRQQQAWAEVQLLLTRSTAAVAPAGFSARFVGRLAARRRVRHQRQIWVTFGAILAGSVALAIALLYAGAAGLAEGAGQLVKQLVVLRAALASVVDVIGHGVRVLPPGGVTLWRYSLLVALTGLGVATYLGLGGLWAAAVYRFASRQSRMGDTQ
ncbi:MAG TPA: hypothetical protein VGA52_06620 [Anaerolineales bacterium]|jgi:hypothetical protein